MLGVLSVVLSVFPWRFQSEEARKSTAFRERILRTQEEIKELIAQKRLSPEDGQRLLKVIVEEAFVLKDEPPILKLYPQERKP